MLLDVLALVFKRELFFFWSLVWKLGGGVLTSALLALLHHSYHVGFEFLELNLVSFIITFDFLDECCPLSVADDELRASAEDILEILSADSFRAFGKIIEHLFQSLVFHDDLAIKRGLQKLWEVDLAILPFVDGAEDIRHVFFCDVLIFANFGHRTHELLLI